MDCYSKKMIFGPKRDTPCRIETSGKNWLFWLHKSNFCNKIPKPKARFKALNMCQVSSKKPSRVQDGNEGVARRNDINRCPP